MTILLIAIVSTLGVLVSGIALVALIGKWAVDTGRGRPQCSPSRITYTGTTTGMGCPESKHYIVPSVKMWDVTEEFAQILTNERR